MVGIGSIVSGVGSVLGGVGSAAGGSAEIAPRSGLDAEPEEIRDTYLDFLLPATLGYASDPFYQFPMMRYDASPDDPFYNPAFAQTQAYSDAIGGLFTSTGQRDATEGATRGGIGQDAYDELLGRLALMDAADQYIAPQARSGIRGLGDKLSGEALAKLGRGEYNVGTGIFGGSILNDRGAVVSPDLLGLL